MLKKVFAFAGLTALTGVLTSAAVAGCTTETEIVEGDSGTDARPDRVAPDVTEPPPEPEVCPIGEEVDVSNVNYKPAAVDPGKCTEQHLTDVVAWVKDSSQATFKDLRDKLIEIDADCAACVFQPGGDGATTWSPLPISEETATSLTILKNYGTCVEVHSGSEACGKAAHQWAMCLDVACNDCEDGQVRECASAAQGEGEACGAASQALLAACTADVNKYLQACNKQGQYPFEEAMRAQCIGLASTDAGADAAQ
jgi:hypothetical protein